MTDNKNDLQDDEIDILDCFPITNYNSDPYTGREANYDLFYIYPEDDYAVAQRLNKYSNDFDLLINDYAYSCLIAMINDYICQKYKMIKNYGLEYSKDKIYDTVNVMLIPYNDMIFRSDFKGGSFTIASIDNTPERMKSINLFPKFIGSKLVSYNFEKDFDSIQISDKVKKFISEYINAGTSTKTNKKYEYEFVSGKVIKHFFSYTKASFKVTPSDLTKKIVSAINNFKISGLDYKFELCGFINYKSIKYSNTFSQAEKIHKFGDQIEISYCYKEQYRLDKERGYSLLDKDGYPLPVFNDMYQMYGQFEVKKCDLLDKLIKNIEEKKEM